MNPYFWCCERWAKKPAHPGGHLSPGIEDSEIRKGLYPTPPNLSKPTNAADSDRTDAHRFWIIKHGVKASGMPAWSKDGMPDEAIWDLTAFLKIMPSLSPAEYRQQVEASDGHSHGGLEGSKPKRKASPAPNILTIRNRIPTSTVLISPDQTRKITEM